MQECPDKKTLEKFIDYGLDEEMNEQIFSHLTTCNHCLEKVNVLLGEEQRLLEFLLPTSGVIKNKVITSTEGCLSKSAILAYGSKRLNEQQTRWVENHLNQCDKCLLETIATQRHIAASADMEIQVPTLDLAEEESIIYPKEILEIILGIADNIIETIKHNGELLSLRPAFGTLRGINDDEKRPIGIRKDFKDRDLSVEVKIISEHGKANFNLIISLMKISNEEFTEGIDIELKNEVISYRSTTDERGVAEFSNINTGTYAVVVDKKLTVHIEFE
jgi:hypothetical protein